jgi:hypothetical protein
LRLQQVNTCQDGYSVEREYAYVQLFKLGNKRIHVSLAWLYALGLGGPPPTPDHTVDHEDGNPSNNALPTSDDKRRRANETVRKETLDVA